MASFHETTTLSTGEGLALLGANCPQTYWGPDLGSWSLRCSLSGGSSGDESVVSAHDQRLALQFAEHHASRLPAVVLARIGRLWDLYQPIQEAHIESHEGRPVPASLAGLAVYYLMIPLGIAGVLIFRRHRIRQWFLLVPAGVLTVVSALVYGLIRFRDPFEVCLAVLAAPPIVLLAGAVRHRRTASDITTFPPRRPR